MDAIGALPRKAYLEALARNLPAFFAGASAAAEEWLESGKLHARFLAGLTKQHWNASKIRSVTHGNVPLTENRLFESQSGQSN
eukprot:1687238-Amphidinium_carterae.1